MTIFKDKYILLSLAAVSVLMLMCAVGSFSTEGTGGNGSKELVGIISDPSASQNGTTFKVTDRDGNETRCFYSSEMPEAHSFCKLVGKFSQDGNMFFVDTISPGGVR